MITRIYVALLFAIAVGGCSTARMPVDSSLASGEHWVVEGRQGWKIHERITFGAFAAEQVDRSWVKGSGLGINDVELNRRKQKYTFTLSDAGTPLYTVSCEARLRHGALHTPIVDVELRNRSRLDCLFDPVGTQDRAEWLLTLMERGERPLTGTLSSTLSTLDVDGTDELSGGLPAAYTTGYYVRLDGQVVGAIDVLNEGAVRLRSGTPNGERQAIAGAAAALLLLEDLRVSLEEV